jgi:RNA polymerase sigma-70 factor (ECF subfamily)
LLSQLLPNQWQKDEALLRRAVTGDSVAATALVKRLTPKAHALAWRTLNQSIDAEDVVQEAFIKLFRSEQFNGQSSLATYFHVIVSRLCLDKLKAGGARFEADDDLGNLQSADLMPDGAYEKKQSGLVMQDFLQKLNIRQRMAVSMWAYQDASTEEIAKVLDIEVNAAHQLLHRAKSNLQKMILK